MAQDDYGYSKGRSAGMLALLAVGLMASGYGMISIQEASRNYRKAIENGEKAAEQARARDAEMKRARDWITKLGDERKATAKNIQDGRTQ
jgi:hypothetical protein